MIKLAIVSPCYNEEAVLHSSSERLNALYITMIAAGEISPESFVLFVNDGRRDATWQIIEDLH